MVDKLFGKQGYKEFPIEPGFSVLKPTTCVAGGPRCGPEQGENCTLLLRHLLKRN
jgi:hypothetical protein